MTISLQALSNNKIILQINITMNNTKINTNITIIININKVVSDAKKHLLI